MKPWKLTDQDPGECNVADRTTGRTVGYLRQDFHGNWTAYSVLVPGWALPFGWARLTGERWERIGWAGRRRPVLVTARRDDAAERVWQAWTAGR